MKTILVGLLAAGWLLAACSPRIIADPQGESGDENLCLSGTEFVPGETIFLGATAEFSAVLKTGGTFEPWATLMVTLPDGSYPFSLSVLPRNGEVETVEWGNWVGVVIANCSERYYYRSFINEVVMPQRDDCGIGYGGPMKPWPFANEILVFRSASREEVWLVSGSSGEPALLGLTAEGRLTESIVFERSLTGQTVTTAIPAAGGTLMVTLKNCQKVLYYAANWRP
ncbi:MAG: hypothetical protein WAV56_04720 [Microgenomates group bacterium]|mgnify:FL=1